MDIGPTELIIILVIVLLLFGPGRIANVGGEMGKAIAEFRKGLAKGADREEPAAPKADVPPVASSTNDTVA
ncbi:MAG: twin-arginine translocase TatA/TatE family subunit [Anaerolineaceae bacterium]|nr:twin-arginine translocase TatA/TatE family subunit [Anaerolineaceae bacterium]